jgi:hypothetical protein
MAGFTNSAFRIAVLFVLAAITGVPSASGTIFRPPDVVECFEGDITNTTPPTVSGTAQVGGVLTTSDGTWSVCGPHPITSYTYQWLRNGAPIGGATAQSYTVADPDAGSNLSSQVTAYNDFGPSSPATSNSVFIPAPPPPTTTTTTTTTGTTTTTTSTTSTTTTTVPGVCFGMTLEGECAAGNSNRHNFGVKYRGSKTAGLFARGSRAGITAPSSSADFRTPFEHGGVVRAYAESYSTGIAGLIQVGFGLSNFGNVADCGYRTGLSHYWEYHRARAGETFHCAWLDGTPVVFGGAKLYTVFRNLQSETGNTTTWQANIDGVQKLRTNVYFDGADVAGAGGELVFLGANGLQMGDGVVNACIGCQATHYGVIPWQMTTAAGSAQWSNVNSVDAKTLNTDGKWVFGTFPAWTLRH